VVLEESAQSRGGMGQNFRQGNLTFIPGHPIHPQQILKPQTTLFIPSPPHKKGLNSLGWGHAK